MWLCAFVRSKDARLGGSGGILPQESLEIRCSEIATGAIFGEKQSRSSYYTCIYISSNAWLSYMHFAKPADFKFPQEKVLRLAEQ